MSDMLHAELKKWINVIIQNKGLNSLESVQAMLIVACYSGDRLLILSFATRMALDLGLHEAFEELTERLAMKNDENSYGVADHDFEKERVLMRKSRTWFGLLVLEHMLVFSNYSQLRLLMVDIPDSASMQASHLGFA